MHWRIVSAKWVLGLDIIWPSSRQNPTENERFLASFQIAGVLPAKGAMLWHWGRFLSKGS
jgi:hypothetical protein